MGRQNAYPKTTLSNDEVNQREVAEYVVEMLDGLQPFARRAGLGFLAYLLELARIEAISERDRCVARRLSV